LKIAAFGTAVAEKDSRFLRFPAQGTSSGVLELTAEWRQDTHRFLATVAARIRYTNSLISEKTPWVEELRKQIHYDKLTDCTTDPILTKRSSRALPGRGAFAVIVIKPDNFKDINDNFGHEAGDKMLRSGQIFTDSIGPKNTGIRFRGDEFVAILPDADVEDAVHLAERLMEAYRCADTAGVTGNPGFRLTASVGVAVCPEHCACVDAVRTAFEKMLDARNSGGNTVRTTRGAVR
jgi:diguanylate cyclase (GGDEF)-like protein